ncbi:AGR200Wp [Eremothecium gossypii ATCC 10895]|uniref:low-specificity L-threonine aldolase n=1 Tax=Eremothecium gossypii (strain ATCC 10895 / CBS 109.51 / FGSC 9923 / NRRL Y-1056) TaxID=284811 RepID=Q74ZK0_EREGS|nr:AGR200Wp [Eremothecium gossypii ATCC 10895]AAS54690.2 AGR200Wp [Eremothecium gossypii ATCC 10895]AEY99020.1 FAGR200Wp [Eremothecium gossypii FDAG1]
MLPARYLTSRNDFRSDTFTLPTAEVWAAGAGASLGDTVYQEDTDTCALEARVAQEFGGARGGDAAGLMCVSTTMANQLAVRALLDRAPPYSVLCDRRAHVYVDECAGLAVLSQALVIPAEAANGRHLTLEDVQRAYVPDDGDTHGAPTRVVALENTLHGMCFPLEEMRRICDWAHAQGMLVHLDGARLWNAAAAQPGDAAAYMRRVCALFDSVSLCLSKSVGAPVGSVLVGGRDLIRRARHLQKQQGGGIRQAGFLARMADYCITKNVPGLGDVAARAAAFWRDLHDDLRDHHGMQLHLAHPVETNFVFIDLERSGIEPSRLLEFGAKNDVRLFDGRLAFHFQNVEDSSLAQLKQVFVDLAAYYREHPYVAPAGPQRRY